MKYSSSLLR